MWACSDTSSRIMGRCWLKVPNILLHLKKDWNRRYLPTVLIVYDTHYNIIFQASIMSGPIWYVVPSNTHLNAVVILSTVLTERKLTPRKQSGHLCDRMEVKKNLIAFIEIKLFAVAEASTYFRWALYTLQFFQTGIFAALEQPVLFSLYLWIFRP